jgi:hypothetical protein
MPLSFHQFIVLAGQWLLVLGIPAVTLFAPIRRLAAWKTWQRVLLACVISWPVLLTYQFLVVLPLVHRVAKATGNPQMDGVGGNVAILLMGWSAPLPWAALMIIGRWLWRRYARRSPTA